VIDLSYERTATEARIAELRQARGAALIDGIAFPDDRELWRLEAKLDAIAAAEIEESRRNRAVRDANENRRVAEIVARLRIAHKLHAEALVAGQKAMGELVEAFLRIIASASEIRTLWDRIGKPPPPGFTEKEVPIMLSHRLIAALYQIGRHKSRFGEIRFMSSTGGLAADWVAREPDFDAFTRGNTHGYTNGHG
jgi:hypothetical protein